MLTDPEKRAVRRGATSAARNLGAWPVSGTLDQHAAAVVRARRETDRAVECWVRWRRMFDPPPAQLEIGSERVNIRHTIALGTFEQLSEAVALLTGPPEGSA